MSPPSPEDFQGKGRILLLRVALGEPEVRRVLDELSKDLEGRGIHLAFSTDHDEVRDAVAYYFSSAEVRITHVEDHSTGISYIEAHPRVGDVTEDVMRRIRRDLPILDLADLRRIAASGYRESPELLIALGTAEEAQEDAGTLSTLRAALSDVDETVRDYAVQASAQTGWRGLLPDLDAVASGDRSENVRNVAKLAAQIVRANSGE